MLFFCLAHIIYNEIHSTTGYCMFAVCGDDDDEVLKSLLRDLSDLRLGYLCQR